jgi:hypothetical protein
MRHLKFLPLAFIAGVHGFAILAPYLGLCAAVHALSVQRRRRARRLDQIASLNVGIVGAAERSSAAASPV